MRWAALFALTVLGGCTVGSDYARPAPPQSPAISDAQFLRARHKQDSAAPLAAWWKELGDAELDRLIETGLKNAPTIAAAEARTRQARAGLTGARAASRPAIGASAAAIAADLPQGSFGTSDSNSELFLAGFDARWEIDLWGGHRRAVEQRRAESDAADAILADAQVQLTAEIARTYTELRGQQAISALLENRFDMEVRLGKLADERYKAGTVPLQVPKAVYLRNTATSSDLQAARAWASILRDALAVLTGSPPGTLDKLPLGAVPEPPRRAKTGDPEAMLARRPDVRAAERRLAAANAAIGVQQARRFPRITLLGLIGIGGSDASDVFEPSKLTSIAAPQLSWSFLDFGRTTASVRGAEATRDAANAEYDGSVLAALQDAETALTRFESASATKHNRYAAVDVSRTIARLDAERAEAGTLSVGGSIETTINLINAQIAEAESATALTTSYIALAKALGLGWDTGSDRK